MWNHFRNNSCLKTSVSTMLDLTDYADVKTVLCVSLGTKNTGSMGNIDPQLLSLCIISHYKHTYWYKGYEVRAGWYDNKNWIDYLFIYL